MPPNFSDRMNPHRPLHPFRRAVLRGLGVVLPPLLTIVIFVWVGNTVAVYLLDPLEGVAERAIVWSIADIRTATELKPDEADPNFATVQIGDQIEQFRRVNGRNYVPLQVYDDVVDWTGADPAPTATASDVYHQYVQLRYLRRQYVVPVFLCFFIVLLYLLGRFLAAGVGKFFWGTFERGIHRLPIIRNVYSSVKQVTDFLFSERDVEYTRVVAVEYPRKGIWSLGLVTGESMSEFHVASGEAMLSVLVPTSPMPFTGFTVTVKKSETIELDISIDQAFQFIVSCGVVVPPHQLVEALDKQASDDDRKRIEASPQPALEASVDKS